MKIEQTNKETKKLEAISKKIKVASVLVSCSIGICAVSAFFPQNTWIFAAMMPFLFCGMGMMVIVVAQLIPFFVGDIREHFSWLKKNKKKAKQEQEDGDAIRPSLVDTISVPMNVIKEVTEKNENDSDCQHSS